MRPLHIWFLLFNLFSLWPLFYVVSATKTAAKSDYWKVVWLCSRNRLKPDNIPIEPGPTFKQRKRRRQIDVNRMNASSIASSYRPGTNLALQSFAVWLKIVQHQWEPSTSRLPLRIRRLSIIIPCSQQNSNKALLPKEVATFRIGKGDALPK